MEKSQYCIPLRTRSPSPFSQTQGQAHSQQDLQKRRNMLKECILQFQLNLYLVEYPKTVNLFWQQHLISIIEQTTKFLQPNFYASALVQAQVLPKCNISRTPWRNLFKSGINVHLYSKINWLDFGSERSWSLWLHVRPILFMSCPFLINTQYIWFTYTLA